jgi:hypothetical protein
MNDIKLVLLLYAVRIHENHVSFLVLLWNSHVPVKCSLAESIVPFSIFDSKFHALS